MEGSIMKDQLIKYRRELHRIPEIGFELYKTREYVLENLRRHRCAIEEISGGVVAFFQSREDGGNGKPREHTVALRSDMDALPIKEETGVPWQSIHDGVMHACGHDGHMAMLLALADELDHIIHTLPHNVLLIFQPAEETSGGAWFMCATGFMSKYNVKRVYGFHLWPTLGKNVIGARPKEFMANACEIDITVLGKNAHCANAEEGIDALVIGCQLIDDFCRMEREELPESEYRLLKFGRMESGTLRNIISAQTKIEGTLRCFKEETGDFLLRRMQEIAAGYEAEYGCRITFRTINGHAAVINDPEVFKEAKGLLSPEYEFHIYDKPFMQAEDFSFYLREAPGLFLFLGTGSGIPLHTNNYDFDEDVLRTGVDIYLKLLTLAV